MRIVILVSGFPPKWLAGTEIATYNIAKYLAKKGHEVHVITSLDEGLPNESIEEGFFVHRVRTINKPVFAGLTHNLMSFLRITEINPDIVHCQFISSGVAGFLAKKLMKKPYVVWGQGSDVYLPWTFKKPISKLVFKNSDAIIALTEDMGRYIKNVCKRDVFVIPNGIDLKRFENISRDIARKKLKIENDHKIILFVGTLRPVKNVGSLIKAMAIIKQKNQDARLMIVGYGEERNYLENLVKEVKIVNFTKFIGKVQNEKIPEYMVASDIFVLPSLSEGFGIVNLEAMASGLPIVATDVCGLSEIIKEGENGFLVVPESPNEIADKVLLLLEDNELRDRVSKNNIEIAKEYDWTKIIDKLENIYQRCV